MANAEVRVAIVGDNSSLQSSLDQSQSKLAGFGKTVGKIAIAAGVAAAGGLAILGKASIDAAAQAQQSIGATETVYGKYADSVIRNSKRAATQLGLSADEYRNNANVLGALLSNQGVAQDKLAGKTRSLVKTGADLAATFGGTTADAVNALASAFKGEFDPLEQYGISIKQSTINTEAYRIAGVKTKAAFDELTASQQAAAKQQATNNLITQQSTKAQGQFARETDTLAHQQQVLGAQWENLKVKIGNALLPVVTDLFQRLNTDLMPALNRLATKYLPTVRKALEDLVQGDPSESIDKLRDGLEGIDWNEIASNAGDLADTLRDLGPMFAELSVETVNDSLKVFDVTIGFVADHLDLLRKVLPLVVAGYVGLKSAQLLNQTVGKDSLIGGALQLAQTRQLIVANRELAAAIRETGTAQGSLTGSLAGAERGMSKLKVATTAAAGIAGLGAVAASTQVANDKVSGLLSVLGSAAMGAAAGSVFGPWGTAIGGVVGGLGGLVGALGQSSDAMKDAKPPASDYASALDAITGASSEAARAEAYRALQTKGVLPLLNQYGIDSRTAVDAITGQKAALGEVNAVLAEQSVQYGVEKARLDELKAAKLADQQATATGHQLSVKDMEALQERIAGRDEEIAQLEESTGKRKAAIDALEGEIGAYDKQKAATRAAADAIHVYSDEINKLPKDKRTLIKADGVATSTRDIAKLATKYRLTPKEITTLIKASGVETTRKRVQSLQDKLKDVGKTKPDFSAFKQATNKFAGDIVPVASRGGREIGKAAAEGVKKGAKPDLGPFKRGVQQGVDSAKSTASSGGNQVGGALKSGVLGGVGGLGSALSAAVAGAVHAAIAAGRAAAKAKSPSKRMYELGQDMGDGLVLGVNSKQGDAAKAGKGLVDKLFGDVSKTANLTAEEIRTGLGKATELITKTIDKRIKDDKKAAKVRKALLDDLDKQYDKLKRNAKAQDRQAKALEQAQGWAATLAEYAGNIAQGFTEAASITQVGVTATGKVTLTKILADLRKQAADAAEFRTLITQLAGMGLDKAQIDQLTAAGPQAALATVRAIAGGGQAAVDAIDELERQIAASGAGLGKTLADKFHSELGVPVGTDMANSMVAGIKAQQETLNDSARKMARALANAIREDLKDVHAPATAKTPKGDKGDDGKRTEVTVKLSAQQVSAIQRGREVQADLDAYRAAGGRARA